MKKAILKSLEQLIRTLLFVDFHFMLWLNKLRCQSRIFSPPTVFGIMFLNIYDDILLIQIIFFLDIVRLPLLDNLYK